MPLNPSSYSKIFKSKYVEDDDEPEDAGPPGGADEEEPSTSYSNPKVQELLSKPKPDFERIFSSRYIERAPASSRSPSLEPFTPKRKSYTPTRDYDKIFTSKYLDQERIRGHNPYLTEEGNDEVISHLPPSRASSISRRVTPSSRTTPFSVQSPMRRTYPQISATYDLEDIADIARKEASPVVFDANLSFILGCKSQLKQHVKPIPAHQESDTQSSALSSKIADFLHRTDHVMEEWQKVGKKRKPDASLKGKSRSATNIMIKGFQLYSKANSVDRSRGSENGDTQNEIDEV